MLILPAQTTDIAEIQAIYAYHVLHGAGTFEEQPPSVEEMAGRHARAIGRGDAWLVANDETGVLGFASFCQYRPRPGYRYTAEDSIYVRQDVRGQGVGKALVGALLVAATAAGYAQMVAVIGDAENVGSIGVHASLGFQRAGLLRGVGFKFGRWLDVVYMQKALANSRIDAGL